MNAKQLFTLMSQMVRRGQRLPMVVRVGEHYVTVDAVSLLADRDGQEMTVLHTAEPLEFKNRGNVVPMGQRRE